MAPVLSYRALLRILDFLLERPVLFIATLPVQVFDGWQSEDNKTRP